MTDFVLNTAHIILAAFLDRSITVHIGDWTIIVRPEDTWYDGEDGLEGVIPRVKHARLERGELQSKLSHIPSSVNLAFVTEEVAFVGRNLGYHNLIPVPPVANPSVTLKIELDEPVLIGSERNDGQVFVDNSSEPFLARPIYDVADLPEYSFGIVHLVSKEVAQAALEQGRYDIVANT